MKAITLATVFALGLAVGLLSPSVFNQAIAEEGSEQKPTYDLDWKKLARDADFRKAIAVVVNEACIVNNSMIYCD